MTGAGARIDLWLWYARFCKSRSQAQVLIERGQVTLDGAPVRKAAQVVHAGQTVVIDLGPIRRTVIVEAIGVRRGPAVEARTLYREPQPPERLPPGEARAPLHAFRGRP